MIETDVDIQKLDESRVRLQAQLDNMKTQKERNRMGQFATPSQLALQILQSTKELLDSSNTIRFLDPAFGTGAFYGALLKTFPAEQIEQSSGYEIDPHYGSAAQNLWADTNLQLELQDFTQVDVSIADREKANVLICNPPYVRHHHLSSFTKSELKKIATQTTGIELNGLSGLYCYFLLIAHKWLAHDGVACWLIPSEFMDVNYGHQVKEYLLSKVDLIRIHCFDPVGTQFDDALVSSAVVWFKKRRAQNKQRKVQLSFGSTLVSPTIVKDIDVCILSPKQKWSKLAKLSTLQRNAQPDCEKQSRLSDLFEIKRGIATGANQFFILTLEQVQKFELPDDFLLPIFPSPRYVTTDEVQADPNGLPLIEKQLFLLNCTLSEQIISREYPTLWRYLESGMAQEIHKRYLCRHRSPWYSQDKRSPAPLLCTYMGRNEHPFRFILNHSCAIAANVYLMLYPKHVLQVHLNENPTLLKKIFKLIRQIAPNKLIDEGRVYGGGLHKLEPKELGNAFVDGVQDIIPDLYRNELRQMSLF